MVKNLPAMWETWLPPLSWEYPLEKRMATHSSILSWRIPWTEESGRLQPMGLQRVRHTERLSIWPHREFLPLLVPELKAKGAGDLLPWEERVEQTCGGA